LKIKLHIYVIALNECIKPRRSINNVIKQIRTVLVIITIRIR